MDNYLLRQTARVTTPIFFGYIAIGIPFGLMIVNAGYPWWMSLFMSVVMYAGAGQYIAAPLFAVGAPLSEILITECFVNIRHIVYGLSLISKTKDAGRWKPYIIYALTDETYALLTGVDVPKGVAPGPFYGMISLLDQLYWDLGALIGALAYNVLRHYHLAHYMEGIDFALTALFVVILSGQLEKSRDVVPPLIGLFTTIGALVLCKGGLLASTNIIFASIVVGVAMLVNVRGRRFYKEQKGHTVRGSVFLLLFAVALLVVGILVWMEVRGERHGASEARQMLSLPMAIVATICSAAIIFCERLFPFALFSRRNPPALVRFIERYIPSMIMAILVVYSLKDIPFSHAPFGLPHYLAIGLAAVLQRLFKNPMVSIFGSTALFMVLNRLVASL